MGTIGWAVTLVTGAWVAASAAAAADVEVQNYEVNKGFEGIHSTDLSGIACVPLNHGEYRCLAIDDESKFAQLAKIENGAIEAKAKIRLIKKEYDPEPLGEKPSVACPNGPGDFGEFDGEGVAYAPYFYVVGSHGCSRNSGKFRLSSFILARIRVDDSGEPVDAQGNVLDKDDMEKAVVETTYRVSDLLKRADTVREYFGKSLNADKNGLNIEGIAGRRRVPRTPRAGRRHGLRRRGKRKRAFCIRAQASASGPDSRPDTGAAGEQGGHSRSGAPAA